MHFIHTIILSIIEGLTEFLPISSTGHLLIAEKAIGFKDVEDVFTVVIQLGAVAAAAWYFKDDIIATTKMVFKGNKKARAFYLHVLIGLIPAGLLGLVLEATVGLPTSPVVIAVALIVGGVILWATEQWHTPAEAAESVGIRYDSISRKQALLVGIGQCVSLIPGVSRSGSTIVTGLWVGMNRQTATAFSFYLSIPLLVAASALKIVKHHEVLRMLPGGPVQLALGLVVTFFVALVVVTWLLRYVSRHSLKGFAYYRIALGALLLVLVFVGYVKA